VSWPMAKITSPWRISAAGSPGVETVAAGGAATQDALRVRCRGTGEFLTPAIWLAPSAATRAGSGRAECWRRNPIHEEGQRAAHVADVHAPEKVARGGSAWCEVVSGLGH
jgi:hypothetical protein